MKLKHFENRARQQYWRLHIEAWHRSQVSVTCYSRQMHLNPDTFRRWVRYICGEDGVRKQAEFVTEVCRQERLEERGKVHRRIARRRSSVTTELRERGLQAFWAMHIEAMNWSGMGIREYAAAMYLSSASLRQWRNRLESGEIEVDWRAHLHPSARPVAGTSAKTLPAETGLTEPEQSDRTPARSVRRFFSEEQKRAIAEESDQPGVSVSSVARKYGIVTGLLFRWRVEFGVAQKKRAMLASVTLPDGTEAVLSLPDILRPFAATNTVEQADGGTGP